MNRKNFLFLNILFLVVLLTCLFFTKIKAEGNIASVYCEDMGYTSQVRVRADGSQYGVCIFSDGSLCEEWSFYKHECGTTWIVYSFPDISTSGFERYIENLYKDEIISGFSDGTYRPDNIVTRAQMAKFIVKAFNFDVDTTGGTFPDVEDMSDELSTYIQTLKNLDIVSGFSDGDYHPEEPVTRGQVTKFVVGALELKGMSVNFNKTHNFNDIIGTKFEGYISILANIVVDAENIISGFSDGTFRPNRNLKRGAMAKIIDLSRRVKIGESTAEGVCITAGGIWIEKSMQCNGLSERICNAYNGEYDSCGSSCGRYYIGECSQTCEEACYMDEGMSQSEVCESTGGRWVQAGSLETWMCEYIARDAGTLCTDSSQCENLCIVDLTKSELTGICRGTNLPFGCYSEMVNGESQPMICVD